MATWLLLLLQCLCLLLLLHCNSYIYFIRIDKVCQMSYRPLNVFFCICRREHSAYDCYGWYRRFGARTAVCGHGYSNQHPCRTRNTRTYHQRDRRTYRWEGSSPSKGVSTWISICALGGMLADGCLLPRRKDDGERHEKLAITFYWIQENHLFDA